MRDKIITNGLNTIGKLVTENQALKGKLHIEHDDNILKHLQMETKGLTIPELYPTLRKADLIVNMVTREEIIEEFVKTVDKLYKENSGLEKQLHPQMTKGRLTNPYYIKF